MYKRQLDIQGAVEQLGFAVCGTAATGNEAIRLALEERPDLILMDIGLAGNIDGIETASRIHDVLNIPIIFLTAYSDQVMFTRAEAALPAGYIRKPLDIKELHIVIEHALYDRTGRAAKRSEDT